MANDFSVSIDVAASADAAWALAGDPVGITKWFAPVASVAVIGDERHATMGNGAVLVEQLVDRDEAARRYAYVVRSGIPGLTSHRATVQVDETPSGARVTWRQVATSDDPDYDMEKRLRGVMTAGLERLRALLEAGGAHELSE